MRSALEVILTTVLLSPAFQPNLVAQHSEMQSDRIHRDTLIHWPPAYDPMVAHRSRVEFFCLDMSVDLSDAPGKSQ